MQLSNKLILDPQEVKDAGERAQAAKRVADATRRNVSESLDNIGEIRPEECVEIVTTVTRRVKVKGM